MFKSTPSSSLLVELKIIGYVRVDADDEYVRSHAGTVVGSIEILPEYEEALNGLEEYSHIFIISILHKIPPEGRTVLKVRPRRLLRIGFREREVPLVGVFASDSPARPNPIGLTLVRLLKREGRVLRVEGLDLFDGTPLVDIKPYKPDYRVEEYNCPDWAKLDSNPQPNKKD